MKFVKLEYVHSVKGSDGKYVAEFNLPSPSPGFMAPIKLEAPSKAGVKYKVTVNGNEANVTQGEMWSALLNSGTFKSSYNKLEITTQGGRDDSLIDEDHIAVYGSFRDIVGPVMSEGEFYKHLNPSIPEFVKVLALAKKNDLKGAAKLFADYVRANYKVPQEIEDSFKKPDNRGYVERMAYKSLNWEQWYFGAYRSKEDRIEWYFNPTPNNYCEWQNHTAYLEEADYLARYYAMTGDEDYAKVWRKMMQSFFEEVLCPLDEWNNRKSVMWRPLEIGIRLGEPLSNDIYFMMKSPAIADEFIVMYFRSVWEHCHRVALHHSTYGNHLTNEMTGLFTSTCFAPYFKETKEWRELSLSIIKRELKEQIYADGQQIELAPGYHAWVADQFLRVPRGCQLAGIETPPECMKTVSRMFIPWMMLMRPDGHIPPLNDSGANRVKGFLNHAAKLFPDRKDFKWFASEGEESRPPKWLSGRMPYAGFVTMRTSWRKDAIWAFMDGGPFGASHQHEDKLSVQLYAYGTDMIGEGGNYDYDTSEERKYVLSTRAHNTIRIDGGDQNLRATYRWDPKKDLTRKADLKFESTDDFDLAEAAYEGAYLGVTSKGLKHQRTLKFFKRQEGVKPFFAVIDRLSVKDAKKHSYEQIWHLQRAEPIAFKGRAFVARYPTGAVLAMVASDDEANFFNKRGQTSPEFQGWDPGNHNSDANVAIETPVLCGQFKSSKRIVTILQPLESDGDAHIVAVKASPEAKNLTFTITISSGEELQLKE